MVESHKLSRRTAFTIYLISLAGNIAWAVENQFYNVYLYNEIAPVPLYVSLMVAITAVMSTVTAIVMGAVSDVKGKRRFYMIFGFIFWTFTTAMFPFAALIRPVIMAVIMAIIFDCIMTYFGATAYDAAFIAYITDTTTVENRGRAIGILEITTLTSTLIIYGASGFIVLAFGYYFFFIMIGIVTGVFGVLGAYLVKDPDNLKPLDVSVSRHIKSSFNREMLKGNRDCFVLLIGIGIFAVGFNVYFPFILIYLQHHIGLSLEFASLVVFIALMVSIILGIPIGILTDRIGRKKVAIVSLVCESISLCLYAIAQDLIFLIITGILWVLFMSSWHISAQTWIKDLYPPEKFGQFSGYYLIFNVLIGMIVGPIIGGLVATQYGRPIIVDGIPGNVPPPLIYIVGAIIILFALIPVLMAKEKNREIIEPESKIINEAP
ncbi:MAG: MFS transporter [Candidatus Lokiarchaeota archaeon]|nr:MFS transporter [Candidatus Lokiarchaeota archaeon]MBD3338713.1 MFS transporter [Candidatus Lokiarchaeota archaeon]